MQKGIGIDTFPSMMATDCRHSENVFCEHRNRLYEASSVETGWGVLMGKGV
jgi:hypothetical protein